MWAIFARLCGDIVERQRATGRASVIIAISFLLLHPNWCAWQDNRATKRSISTLAAPKESFAELIQDLRSATASVRSAACRTLRKFGLRGADALAQMLMDRDSDVRATAGS